MIETTWKISSAVDLVRDSEGQLWIEVQDQEPPYAVRGKLDACLEDFINVLTGIDNGSI